MMIMSNFLALATVTAALRRTLEEFLKKDVGGAKVSSLRPDESNSIQGTGANLYLYLVTPNAALRNVDLPNRSSEGRDVQRPQVALDLHYLLTFYGKDSELEPQRLLGSAVRTLQSKPILTRKMIEETRDDTLYPYLKNSNLADALETVKFTPVSLSIDEMSKLWSVFFQVPYRLSVAYIASVVLIESEKATPSALPVRERSVYAVPFHQPVIEKVMSDKGEDKPIVAESTLFIRGKKLRGDTTQVIIDGTKVDIENISETQVKIKLPASLISGMHGLQIVHKMQIGTPPVPHNGVESNLFAFLLHPTIKKETDGITDAIMVSNLQGTGNNPRSADLKIKINPKVGEEQRVVLILNEISNVESASYTFVGKLSEIEPETIEIHVGGVKAADYLVRVQVDGAQSQLITNAENQYISPKVTIS